MYGLIPLVEKYSILSNYHSEQHMKMYVLLFPLPVSCTDLCETFCLSLMCLRYSGLCKNLWDYLVGPFIKNLDFL